MSRDTTSPCLATAACVAGRRRRRSDQSVLVRSCAMERVITIHVERLPEGVYLATSDDIQGIVAQRHTVAETLEIARDVARTLIEAQEERQAPLRLRPIGESFDYPLVVGD